MIRGQMDANEWRWSDAYFREHLPGLVDEGYLTREVLYAFLVDWDEQSLEPDAVFFGSPMMEVVGRRP